MAQNLGGGEDLNVSLSRIVAALAICLTIAFLAILLIRQRSGKLDLRAYLTHFSPGPRAIEVVEARRLSPHADICAVRHGGNEYLILLLAGHAEVLSQTAVRPALKETRNTECD